MEGARMEGEAQLELLEAQARELEVLRNQRDFFAAAVIAHGAGGASGTEG